MTEVDLVSPLVAILVFVLCVGYILHKGTK
jgi:hypothetical protein